MTVCTHLKIEHYLTLRGIDLGISELDDLYTKCFNLSEKEGYAILQQNNPVTGEIHNSYHLDVLSEIIK